MAERDSHFDSKQYILGDSAFKASNIMIPSFKKPFGSDLNAQQQAFNTALARIRIKSEHCIGLLKGRFQCLKRIRIQVASKRQLIRINRIIMATCILHNLLVEEPCPSEWMYVEDLDDEDELQQDVEGRANTTRRNQIFAYMLEVLL